MIGGTASLQLCFDGEAILMADQLKFRKCREREKAIDGIRNGNFSRVFRAVGKPERKLPKIGVLQTEGGADGAVSPKREKDT